MQSTIRYFCWFLIYRMKTLILGLVLPVILSTSSFSQLAEKGTIYASTREGDIYKLSDEFKSRSLVLSTGFEKLVSMGIDSSGRVFVSDQYRLYELDLSNGNSTYLASLPDSVHVLDNMGTLTFDQNNQLYTIKSGTNGCDVGILVYRYNFEQKEFKNLGGYGSSCRPPGDSFISMAFDPRTNGAYGLLMRSGELFRFDVSSDSVQLELNIIRDVVSSGTLIDYRTLFFGPRGDFYAFRADKMVSINKTNGQVIQTIAGNFEYSAVTTRLPIGSDIVSGIGKDIESILAVYPNPATDEVVFSVATKNGGSPRIEIANSLGKIVYERNQRFTVPATRFNWNLRDFSGLKVPAGIYFVRLMVGNKVVEVKKLLVTP